MSVQTNSQIKPAMYLAAGTWSLTLVLMFTLNLLLTGKPSLHYLISTAAVCSVGIALSAVLFAVAHTVSGWPALARWSALALGVIVASALLAVGDATFAVQITEGLTNARRLSVLIQAVNNFGIMVWQFGLLGAAYAMLESNRLAREHEMHLAEARRLAIEAERNATVAKLAALRYQLNPHFLFNTLNAISSLVITRRNAEAEDMLSGLSDFLRATLASDPDALISVDEELATLQTYLEVESKRFTDRLVIDVDCTPALRDAQVPGFILQPLIENAIKYAVAPSRVPVTVRVQVLAQAGMLVMEVSDNGENPGLAAKSMGVGHTNIRQRLQVLYGDQAGLETECLNPGFRARIRIPLGEVVFTDVPQLLEAAE